MKHRIIAVLLLAVAGEVHAADPLPTPDEIQKLADHKDWAGLLAATTRVLAVKGPATAAFDRADLWMKKGEAQLQSSQFQPASQSFAKVADEKTATPEQVDLGLATSRLAKRSDAKGYKTPSRLGPTQTFDVLDIAKRPEAFAAMLNADLVDLKQKVDQNKTVVEPRLILDTFKTLNELRPVDRVVNKNVAKTDEVEKTIATYFVEAATKWADSTDVRLEAISTAANEMVAQRYTDSNKRTYFRQTRRGLAGNDAQELQSYMQRAQQWAGNYTAIQQPMSENGKSILKPAEAAIQRIYDKAKVIRSDAARPN